MASSRSKCTFNLMIMHLKRLGHCRMALQINSTQVGGHIMMVMLPLIKKFVSLVFQVRFATSSRFMIRNKMACAAIMERGIIPSHMTKCQYLLQPPERLLLRTLPFGEPTVPRNHQALHHRPFPARLPHPSQLYPLLSSQLVFLVVLRIRYSW